MSCGSVCRSCVTVTARPASTHYRWGVPIVGRTECPLPRWCPNRWSDGVSPSCLSIGPLERSRQLRGRLKADQHAKGAREDRSAQLVVLRLDFPLAEPRQLPLRANQSTRESIIESFIT